MDVVVKTKLIREWEMDLSKTRQFTAVIEREGAGYFALCPELDVASQVNTIEEARSNLVEALELFLEAADPSENRAPLAQ